MGFNFKAKWWLVVTILFTAMYLSITPALAETYRWKDASGKVHYGAMVPTEYADQPYDVLNDAGLVIRHVERPAISPEVKEEIKEEKPSDVDEERQIQADRLLLIQYDSEEEIQTALEHEIAQLGYDLKLINQSLVSTKKTIREQISLAANRQRANLEVTVDQRKTIEKLSMRVKSDEVKLEEVQTREQRIRERFTAKIERFRQLALDKRKMDET